MLHNLLRTISLPLFIVILRAANPEFESNFGQAESRYLFLGRAGATRAYIEDRGFELATSSGPKVRLLWVGGSDASVENRGDWNLTEPSGNISYYCNQPKSNLCAQGVPGHRRLVRKGLYAGI